MRQKIKEANNPTTMTSQRRVVLPPKSNTKTTHQRCLDNDKQTCSSGPNTNHEEDTTSLDKQQSFQPYRHRLHQHDWMVSETDDPTNTKPDILRLPNVPKIKDAESENIFVSISADTTWSAVFRPHFGTINSPSRNMCTPLVLAKRKLTN